MSEPCPLPALCLEKLKAIWEKLEDLEEGQKHQNEMLLGNGKPGLFSRMDLAEERDKVMDGRINSFDAWGRWLVALVGGTIILALVGNMQQVQQSKALDAVLKQITSIVQREPVQRMNYAGPPPDEAEVKP